MHQNLFVIENLPSDLEPLSLFFNVLMLLPRPLALESLDFSLLKDFDIFFEYFFSLIYDFDSNSS
jgi:hypothetical protein